MINLNDFIDFNDYNNFSVIDQNNYTSILTANKKVSPYKKLLFKIFKFPRTSAKNQKNILEAFVHIRKMKNQYLIKYKKIAFYYKSKHYTSILMKYVSSKTLQQVITENIHNQTFLTETSIFNCLFAVCEALNCLHNHIIVHGNLCPSNIILDELNQIYVSDFGLYPIKKLYIAQDDLFNKDYKDPFMVNNEPSFKNDIYSFGILICHLFLVFNQTKNSNENHQETLEEFIKNPNPNKYSKFPKFLKEMILSCLNEDMNKRPTFKQIIEIFKTVKSEPNSINVSELYSKFIKTDYVKKLAKANNPQALNQVGNMYGDETSTKNDYQKSLKCYKKASNLNYSEAQSSYGVMIQDIGWKNKPNLEEGAKKIKESASQGNVHGIFNYGIILLYSEGVKQDKEKGFKYLKKAADFGYQKAQDQYGYHLLKCDNLSHEKICEGLEYLQKAMNQNYAEAFFSYACLLKEGKNIGKDEKLSMEYFKIAADNNIPDAMLAYARGNLNGIGVPKNKKVALKYYQLAVANESEEAKIEMDALLNEMQENENHNSDSTLSEETDSFFSSSSSSSSSDSEQEEQENEINEKRKFKLPIQVSSKIKVISLGKVVYDRPNYHNDKYIYPVGYQIEKEYISIENPNKQVIYRATVLDGGDFPIFRVECLDETKMVFEGSSPSKPCVDACLAVEQSKEKFGIPKKTAKVTIRGPAFFGFSLLTVKYLIERLPNAERCAKYTFNNLYVHNFDKPIEGGHEIYFLYEKNLSFVDEEVEEESEILNDPLPEIPQEEQIQNIEEPKEIVDEIEQQNIPSNIEHEQEEETVVQNTTKERNIVPIKRKFKYPIQISPKLKLISIGNVIYDKENYHTDKYIYPVGYEIECEYNSIKNPNQLAIYRATVLYGGDSPLFRVQCLDETNLKFDGYDPSKPWIDAYLAVEASKRKLGLPSKSIINLSGNCNYGFIFPTVGYLIEQLPNVDKCANYIRKKFFLAGIDKPIEGGREVKFFNENDLFEEDQSQSIEVLNHEDDQNESIDEEITSLFDEMEYYQSIDIDFNQSTEELMKEGDRSIIKDPSRAFRCYEEVVNRGYLDACLKCAQVSPSFEIKLEYYEMAIKNKIPGSFNEWRKSIIKHVSLVKDKDIIISLARRFEKHNDYSDAAYLYRKGKDILNYQICYEKAKRNIKNIKDGYQQYYFGIIAKKQNELKLARKMFEKAFENNVLDAQNKIIEIDQMPIPQQKTTSNTDFVERAIDFYEGRNGQEINIEIALVLFKEASKIGSPVADYYIGKHYQNEYGARYLKKSADNGHVDAQKTFADYLMNGIGVEKNYTSAMRYYKVAADHGNIEASFIYGKEIFMNSSTNEEKQEGISYLKRSAEKLYPDAIYFYSKIISETNPYDSLKFYEYALEIGSKLAIDERKYRRNLQNLC